MIELLKKNKYIVALVLWQLVSVYLMAVGVWPTWIAWINVGLLAASIAALSPFDALRVFVVSIPFYVVVPNNYADTLSMWRLLIIWLFIVVSIKQLRTARFQLHLKHLKSTFLPWDWWLLSFGVILLLSMFVAKYPVESAKQIIFLGNAALLYIVVRVVILTKENIRASIVATASSLGIIVAFGYLQYISTFFSSQYYFWQYWATRVSSLYYGQSLADVLAYSNSWFSTSVGGSSLRMFSIMPDSHSFAMVAALFIGFVLSIIYFRKQESKSNGWLWFLVVTGALAIMFAGTRGVWVGMLAPLVIAPILYFKRVARSAVALNCKVYGIILLLFVLSPLMSQGIGLVRSAASGSFLDRATSVDRKSVV